MKNILKNLSFNFSLFLMHRVELKESLLPKLPSLSREVPNAPCGVERFLLSFLSDSKSLPVPNAPCGVESLAPAKQKGFIFLFLMHRVELKVNTCSVNA